LGDENTNIVFNRIGATVPLTGQSFGVFFFTGVYLPQKLELAHHLETELVVSKRRVLFYILNSTPVYVEQKLSIALRDGRTQFINGNLFKYSPFLRGEKPPFLALFKPK
jgi:hypothetical protein